MTDLALHPNNLPSKEIVQVYVQHLITSVQEGNIDPLAVFIFCRALEKISEEVLPVIKDSAIDSAAKYNKNDAVFHGVPFSLRQNKGTLKEVEVHDFSNIPEWRELQHKIVALQDQIDTIRFHQQRIEKLSLSGEADPQTGELYNPPVLLEKKTTGTPPSQSIVVSWK